MAALLAVICRSATCETVSARDWTILVLENPFVALVHFCTAKNHRTSNIKTLEMLTGVYHCGLVFVQTSISLVDRVFTCPQALPWPVLHPSLGAYAQKSGCVCRLGRRQVTQEEGWQLR